MKLGDRFAKLTKFFGADAEACAECKKRKEALNLVNTSQPFLSVVSDAVIAFLDPDLFTMGVSFAQAVVGEGEPRKRAVERGFFAP